MARFAILRVVKLRKMGNIGASGQHGHRERPTDNADPDRLAKNEILCGPRTAQGIVDAVKRRLAVVTHKSAKDPVPCLEYLVAYSPEASVARAPNAYFRDALDWLRKRHGEENIVSAMIHNDETTPHMAVYAVPINKIGGTERRRNVADGRNPDGSQRRKTITQIVKPEIWLSAAAFVGSRAKLRKLQTDFAKEVGSKHELRRGIERSGARHTTIKQFYGLMNGGVPPGFGQEYARLAKAAQAEATRQRLAAEAARKRLDQLEQQLKQLRLQLGQQKRNEAGRLAQQEGESARTIEGYQSLVERLSEQLREMTRRITLLLQRIWNALHLGGVPAASQVLIDATRVSEDLDFPEPPRHRIDVREMASGGWRAAVLDPSHVELWSDVFDELGDARAAAEAWIQSAPAPEV